MTHAICQTDYRAIFNVRVTAQLISELPVMDLHGYPPDAPQMNDSDTECQTECQE